MEYLFDKTWFQKWQKQLLWLLNTPVIKVWFRWVLRIRKHDCSLKERICEIQPNNYNVHLGLFLTDEGLRHKFRRDFRTHNKYSKRLLYAFYPLWLSFHIWDMLVANNFVPQLNLGFDTLTVYPDPDIETTSVDGRVARLSVSEVFSTIMAGAGNFATDSETGGTQHVRIICTDTPDTDKYSQLIRSIYLFDTSSLDDGATISAGVLSLFGTAKQNDLPLTTAHVALSIVNTTPASNTALVNADYGQLGTTKQSTDFAYDSFSTSAYNDITLNATGIASISKTGITKFGSRFAVDVDAGTPAWTALAQSSMSAYYADNAGTTNDPKLVVTYTVAVAGGTAKNNLLLMGV